MIVKHDVYNRHAMFHRHHRAAARLIGGFRQFDHISHYVRDVLHWLPFPQLISYRIASLVWRCLSGWAPSYLPSSLLMFRPSYTPVLCSRKFGGPIRPLCDNADRFIFCGWSKNLEWTSSRSKAPPKRCLFSIPPPPKHCSFPLGLGRERL